MKKFLPLTFFFLLAWGARSQSPCNNLITNGGFETINSCPTVRYNGDGCEAGSTLGNGDTGDGLAAPWLQLTYGSADVWNACYDPVGEIAANPPYAGDGFAGFYTYISIPGVWCEYIGQQLSSPLVAGKTYCLDFYARTNSPGNDLLSDDIEVVFTNTQILSPTPFYATPLAGYVPAYTFSFAIDPPAAGWGFWGWGPWEHASYMYTATGGEEWISFGQFAPISFSASSLGSYIHIDEISLVESASFTVDVQTSTCGACDGSATVSSTGNFMWYDGAGNLIATDTNQVSDLCPGNYSVSLTCGCTSQTENFQVGESGTNLSIVPVDDEGCEPFCTPITFASTSAVASASWDLDNGTMGTGLTTTTACYAQAGEYIVTATVTDTNGCTSTASDTIEVYPNPVAGFYFLPEDESADGFIDFYDHSHGATIENWYWDFYSNTFSVSFEQNPVFYYNQAGDFLVTLVVETDHGCLDTVSHTVHVSDDMALYVPNTFTPDGDGRNDIFLAKGFGITQYHLMVFNRWGELIFETHQWGQGWDGKHQGKKDELVQDEVYTWKIQYMGRTANVYEKTGHVTLIK